MIIEYQGKTYRVEPTKLTLKPYRVWVEIPQVDFTGLTRTHWRRLPEGPTADKLIWHYKQEQARRTSEIRHNSRAAIRERAAEMFESTEVRERTVEKTIDRLTPRHRKWRIA